MLLDGGMGTMLQQAGLPLGVLPESWNITHPEVVTGIHRRYVEAGSQVIFANTFGANPLKAAGSGYDLEELISAGIRCAKEAAGTHAQVALDVGPLGRLMEPLGPLSFEEAYEMYCRVLKAGEAAGADRVIFETLSDLQEVRAGVLAAKENTSLPVWATMTFEASGRTFLGVTVPAMALTLSGLGVEALGFNCSLGPAELTPLLRELRAWTDLPLILKPNAGLPDPVTGSYPLAPGEFAALMETAPSLGARYMGGCCGTDPAFIRELAKKQAAAEPAAEGRPRRYGICSARSVAETGRVRIIGERINPTGKKRMQQALRENDLDYILSFGIQQQEAGADILDVNVGLPGVDERGMMIRVIQGLQAATDLPLQIDSSDPAVVEAGLRTACGKCLVNSVNGKRESLDAILPLCKKYGAAVVGLCLDEEGIPETWEGRMAIARRIVEAADRVGIPRQDVYIDCLTLTVSAQQSQAAETLKALRAVKKELGVQTVLGVSNISFGLPERQQINLSFLTQALAAGLDCPIMNPNQNAMRKAVAAFQVLSGEDAGADRYIQLCAAMPELPPAAVSAPAPGGSKPEANAAPAGGGSPLREAVIRGQGSEVVRLTEGALSQKTEMEVIEQELIPALNEVGDRYERQMIFLPQLLRAAQAASAGFEVLKARLAAQNRPALSRGKILIATVQGDIHDIGKNIVRVVLENYGYTVLDLGRDVPPEEIVETALREKAPLVGLSALMTTTLPAMEKTIRMLREAKVPCKVMVGGAVLTEEYAREIGADYYARDAKRSADIAREVMNGLAGGGEN
ncbi:MAG: homocysteine S-methyltransferase family protein [Clostridia bacterium]|nr:homocysteine S-methyltransferase family protein [Clostridia bacterium]